MIKYGKFWDKGYAKRRKTLHLVAIFFAPTFVVKYRCANHETRDSNA